MEPAVETEDSEQASEEVKGIWCGMCTALQRWKFSFPQDSSGSLNRWAISPGAVKAPALLMLSSLLLSLSLPLSPRRSILQSTAQQSL